jgi:hypothetical protein
MADFKSPFDIFEVDEHLETDGITVDYGPFWFRIGRIDKAGTPFARYMTEKLRPYTRAIQLGEMDPKVAEALTREAFAKFLTYAWGSQAHGDGKMVAKDGKAIAFTPENVEQLFKTLPALFEDLLGESKKMGNFRKLRTEEDAGNLPPSSGTA